MHMNGVMVQSMQMKNIFSVTRIIFIFFACAVVGMGVQMTFAADAPADVVITIEPIKNSDGVIIAYRALDPKTGEPMIIDGNQATFKGPIFGGLAYPQFNAMKKAYEANIKTEFTFYLDGPSAGKVTLNPSTEPATPAKPVAPATPPSDWVPAPKPTNPVVGPRFITPKGKVVEKEDGIYVVEYEVPDPANPGKTKIVESPPFSDKVGLQGFSQMPLGTDVYYRQVMGKNGKFVGQLVKPETRVRSFKYDKDGKVVGYLIKTTTWVPDGKGGLNPVYKTEEEDFDDDVRDALFPPVAPTAPALTAKPADAPVVKPAEPAPVKPPTWLERWNKMLEPKPVPEKPVAPPAGVPVSNDPKEPVTTGRKPRTKDVKPPADPVKSPAPVAPPVVTNPQMIQYRDAAPRTLIEEPLPLTDTKPKYTFEGAVFTEITDDKGNITGYKVNNVTVLTCPTPLKCNKEIIAEIMVNGATVDEAKKNIKNNDFLQGKK